MDEDDTVVNQNESINEGVHGEDDTLESQDNEASVISVASSTDGEEFVEANQSIPDVVERPPTRLCANKATDLIQEIYKRK